MKSFTPRPRDLQNYAWGTPDISLTKNCARAKRRLESRHHDDCPDLDALPERDIIRERLRRFEQAELIAWQGTRIRLATDALPYARSVAAAFDAWRNEEDMRFSHAV